MVHTYPVGEVTGLPRLCRQQAAGNHRPPGFDHHVAAALEVQAQAGGDGLGTGGAVAPRYDTRTQGPATIARFATNRHHLVRDKIDCMQYRFAVRFFLMFLGRYFVFHDFLFF
jgi:hypothetical protein